MCQDCLNDTILIEVCKNKSLLGRDDTSDTFHSDLYVVKYIDFIGFNYVTTFTIKNILVTLLRLS